MVSVGAKDDRRFGADRRSRRPRLLRTLALLLILIGCLAKSVSPVRATIIAGSIVAAGLATDGAEAGPRDGAAPALASAASEMAPDTARDGPPTACLYAVHCVPLIVTFGFTPRPATMRVVHVMPESAVPPGWQSHPPLRPPRAVA